MHAVPSYAHLPVSPDDVLGRTPQVVFGDEARRLVHGRRVLVTGAGGSIGSEIVRLLHGLEPAAVFMLDHDESALHALQMQLTGHGLLDDHQIVLADVRDRAAMLRIMADVRPHIVYHAAAHKHLTLLERFPAEGFKTNVLGTANVLAAAVASGVERVVNVSTDKAARPTSVLGATKRLAELVVESHAGQGTKVASVRFGNVLGSRGSFLHSLAFQIDTRQPVTVTDPDVTRFFMTIPEAAGLVIESSVMASVGETYVLDMGEPVRIVDIVARYARLSGHSHPAIEFTGLRPGEKMHEELLDAAESRQQTAHRKIFRVSSLASARRDLPERLNELFRLTAEGRPTELLRQMRTLLPADAGSCTVDVRDELPQQRRATADVA